MTEVRKDEVLREMLDSGQMLHGGLKGAAGVPDRMKYTPKTARGKNAGKLGAQAFQLANPAAAAALFGMLMIMLGAEPAENFEEEE